MFSKLLVVLFCSIFCATNGHSLPQRLSTGLVARQIATTITNGFLNRLQNEIERKQTLSNNPPIVVTIIPPVDDPATLQPIDNATINIPIPGLFNITGSLSLGESMVTGLSELSDELTILLGEEVSLLWEMDLPSVAIATTYGMDLLLDLGSTHTIIGSGDLAASVEKVFFRVDAKGRVPLLSQNPIRLDELNVDLGFSNVRLSAGDASVDGTTPVDWEQLGCNVEFYFNSIWNDEVRGLVNEIVRCSIDHGVSNCTLNNLVGPNPEPECLKPGFDIACLGLESTSTISNSGYLEFPLKYDSCTNAEPSQPTISTMKPSDPTANPEDNGVSHNVASIALQLVLLVSLCFN